MTKAKTIKGAKVAKEKKGPTAKKEEKAEK